MSLSYAERPDYLPDCIAIVWEGLSRWRGLLRCMRNDFPANKSLVTAALACQNVRYGFPMRNRFHGGSGVIGHSMVIVSPLRRSVAG